MLIAIKYNNFIANASTIVTKDKNRNLDILRFSLVQIKSILMASFGNQFGFLVEQRRRICLQNDTFFCKTETTTHFCAAYI